MKRTTAAAVAFAAVFILSAMSCDKKGLGDAPIGEQDEAPREVVVMPDKFPNLAYYCDGTTAIVVTTRDAAPVVVLDSKHCTEATP